MIIVLKPHASSEVVDHVLDRIAALKSKKDITLDFKTDSWPSNWWKANPTNGIVSQVHDWARWLAGPFDGMFSFHNPHVAIAVNWGIAAVVYSVVGGLIVSQLLTLYLTPIVYTFMANVFKTSKIPTAVTVKPATA